MCSIHIAQVKPRDDKKMRGHLKQGAQGATAAAAESKPSVAAIGSRVVSDAQHCWLWGCTDITAVETLARTLAHAGLRSSQQVSQ